MDLYIAWVAMLKGRRLTKFSTIQEKVLTRGEISALSQICMESCTRLKVTDMFPLSAPCKQLSMVKAVLSAKLLGHQSMKFKPPCVALPPKAPTSDSEKAFHSRWSIPFVWKLFTIYIYLYFLFKKIDEFKIFKEFETKIKK